MWHFFTESEARALKAEHSQPVVRQVGAGSQKGWRCREPWPIPRANLKAHFLAGSMGPKMASAIKFVEAGDDRATISSLDKAVEALEGRTGTIIVPDPARRPAPRAAARPVTTVA